MRTHKPLALALATLLAAAPLARSDDKKKPEPKKPEPRKEEPRKDDTLLEGTEKVELKDVGLQVVRPSKDWTFVNLEVLNKQEIAKDPSNVRLRESLERCKARSWYGSANANFFVYSWVEPTEDSIEKLGPAQVDATRGFLKDGGKVIASKATKHGKHEAWGFELEGTLNTGGDEMTIAKLVAYRAADKRVFLIALEYPKKNGELLKKDRAKLFANVKF